MSLFTSYLPKEEENLGHVLKLIEIIHNFFITMDRIITLSEKAVGKDLDNHNYLKMLKDISYY